MATKDPSGQVNRQTGPGIKHKGLSAWTSTGILGDFVHSGRLFELFLNNCAKFEIRNSLYFTSATLAALELVALIGH